jgi:hypothetical protein
MNEKLGMGLGGAALGSGIAGLFGGNPSRSSMNYLDQIPGQLHPYYDPYINAGQHALGGLSGQYDQLLGNPGGRLNEIGSSYHQSPGFQFALQQALGAGNRSMAAGGMAGSPQHEQQNMGIATGLADQDYNQYMQNALGLYGQGLSGSQNMANMGLQAGNSMSDQIAQMLAQKAQMKYSGNVNKNQQMGSAFGDILGGLGWLGLF